MLTPIMPTPDQAFRVYKRLVEQNDQAAPILLFATSEKVYINPVVGGDDAAETLLALLAEMVEELGRPQWLILSNEAWMRNESLTDRSVEEVLAGYRHGEAQASVEAGDPAASEAVVIVGVSRFDVWTVSAQFKREAHRVRWQPTRVSRGADNLGGGIQDVMYQVVRGHPRSAE